MSIIWPSRINLARLPTPIDEISRLSDRLGGPQLFVKRDDLTDCPMSGNKIRKLEFLCAEAMGQNATTLLTCGGVQSNHVRTTAIAAARLGMKSVLFLRGEKPEQYTGNILLNKLVGAEIRYVSAEEYKKGPEMMRPVAEELASRGEKAYIIPEGGSNALGTWGYVNACQEISQQEEQLGLSFDYIVCAVGSGGTFGGLVAGKEMFGLNAEIIGFNVCDKAEYFKNRVAKELEQFQAEWGHKVAMDPSRMTIIDGYVGEGYSIPYPEEIETIELLAKTQGIIIEHTYTGKAFHGLVDLIRKGRFKKTDKILFCHTGGIFGILDGQKRFTFQD